MVATRNIPTPGPSPNAPASRQIFINSDHVIDASTILFSDIEDVFALVGLSRDFNLQTGPDFTNNGVLWLESEGGGITVSATNATNIINNGLITSLSLSGPRGEELVGGSSSGLAIGLQLSGDQFVNNGDVFAVSMGGFALGLSSFLFRPFDALDAETVINRGNIYAEALFDATGVADGNSINLNNEGEIISSAGRNATGVSSTDGIINNSGTIRAISDRAGPETSPGVSIAIDFFNAGDITNSGTIEADIAIITDASGQASFPLDGINLDLDNSGTITGAIFSGGGDDILDNSGTITGDIFLGAGQDAFFSQLGRVTGDIFGGDGDDNIQLGIGNDVVDGGSGQDQIFGGAGNDLLIGGRDDDQLEGGAGNDGFSGGFGNDILTLSGGDIAFGNGQDDNFIVSDGQFQLIDGGSGRDTLTFENSGQTLDLSSFVDAGRIASIEVVHISAGSGVAISAANVAALSDGADISITGLGTVTLYDGWSAGNSTVIDGITFVEYSDGTMSVFVADETSVELTNFAPANAVTPAALSGQVAPEVPDIQLDFTAAINEFFDASDDFTIFDNEVYRAVSHDLASQSVVAFRLFENRSDAEDRIATFTNEGEIRAEGTARLSVLAPGLIEDDSAFGLVATSFDWRIENYGLISAQSEAATAQALFAESAEIVENFGEIIAISGNGSARGVNLSNTDISNAGTISATSENLNAFPETAIIQAIVSTGSDIDNSGFITAVSANQAIGIDFGAVITGNTLSNSGTIRAEGTAGLESIGIFVADTNITNIINSGQLIADRAIATRFNFSDAVNFDNSGLVEGDIILSDNLLMNPFFAPEGSGGDNLTNSGIIRGDILTLGGDDTFITTGDGELFGSLDLGNGDDVAVAGSQDNLIFGGEGQDSLSGQAGDDTLIGDGMPALSLDSVEGEVYRAFQAVFDRAPDLGGFNAFVTEVRAGRLTQESVIAEFVTSAEFQQTFGALDNQGFVEQLFRNVLDREGDAQGVIDFTNELNAGSLTRAEVVLEFANSSEFVQLMTLPSASFATNVIIHPAEGQVFRIYQAVFLRDPDEAGFTAFTNSIQAEVLTVEEITAEFVASEEFQLTYGDLDNADFVNLLFANVLPRNTDAQGRADFTEALNAGTLTRETMVAEFVETFEFVQRMSAPAVEFVSDVFTASGDTLDGGTGDDVLFGGRGVDEFVFDTQDGGADIILDFTSGTDSLDLGDNADFDTFAEIMAAGTQVGLDTVFDFGGGNTLTLEGVVLSELTEDDFGFGGGVGNSKPSDAATAVNTPFLHAEAETDIADFELYDMFG